MKSPECQTVRSQIRPDDVGPDLGPNCLQNLLTDDISSQRVNINPHVHM